MAYLRKDLVLEAIEADRETSLLCYDNSSAKNIIDFCYDSILREIESLPQYRLESVEEIEDEDF